MDDLNELYVFKRGDWHSWLNENAEKVSGIWLVFYKNHSGKPSLSYDDAVEVAL